MPKKVFKDKFEKTDPDKLKALIGQKQLLIANLMADNNIPAGSYIPLIAQIGQKPISAELIAKFGQTLGAGKTTLVNPSRQNGEDIFLNSAQHQETSITDEALDIFAHLTEFKLFEKYNEQIAQLVANQLLIQNGLGMLILTEDTARKLNELQAKKEQNGDFSPDFDQIKQIIFDHTLYSYQDLEKLN